MECINRAAVVIRPKQPFVDWLNSIPDEDIDFTLEQVSEDNITFLIPEYDDPRDSRAYIKKIYSDIFEFELFGWITTEELWPQKRTWKMFQEWFDIEINYEVFDLVDGKIEKEEM